MNDNPSISSSDSLKPILIERLLAVQERELVLRNQELEVTKQDNKNVHEYAIAALQANTNERESERKYNSTREKYRYFFGSLTIFLLVILFCVALFLNKDQIVIEIIKAILFVSSGAIGGYALGKKKVNSIADTD